MKQLSDGEERRHCDPMKNEDERVFLEKWKKNLLWEKKNMERYLFLHDPSTKAASLAFPLKSKKKRHQEVKKSFSGVCIYRRQLAVRRGVTKMPKRAKARKSKALFAQEVFSEKITCLTKGVTNCFFVRHFQHTCDKVVSELFPAFKIFCRVHATLEIE